MYSIAIDGPAGAGKSTIAKELAKKLDFIYVDTGALYRTIAFYFFSNNVGIEDIDVIIKHFDKIKINIKFVDSTQHMFLNGTDVSDKIRTPQISMMASSISAFKEVREFLLGMQRSLAENNNVIMDGRDIATVVLPNADTKIFLTASNEVRAKRRYDELVANGEKVNFNDVLDDIKVRDYNDSHRKVAPLKPAPDSVVVDSSDMTVDSVIDEILSIVKGR